MNEIIMGSIITLILVIVGIIIFLNDPYNPCIYFLIPLIILSALLTCLAYNLDSNPKQGTQYSQVQEETKPKINENYNYNYNHNYNYNEGETNTTYNVQTTTEPCTCSNCLKGKNTVPTTTQPNTKCTCSNCR